MNNKASLDTSVDNGGSSEKEMGFIEHFSELRKRLFLSLLCMVLFSGVGYFFSAEIFQFLARPLNVVAGNPEIIFTNLPDAFLTYLKVSFFFGLSLSIPFTLNQLWRFIAPGLYQKERHLALPFLIASPVLFFLGALLVYFILPILWSFFGSFQASTSDGIEIRLLQDIRKYVSLVMRLMLVFGLCFQLPVLLSILGYANIISSQDLKKKRRFAILFAFVIGAFLTPADPFSQFSLALPILALYEISILIIRSFEVQRKKATDKSNGETGSSS